MRLLLVRWGRFNLVGTLGIGVQLAVLSGLAQFSRLPIALAAALAVEAAVLHNFAWHLCYTWKERPASGRSELFQRLLRFHLANGMVSLAGNALLMHLLVAEAGWHYLPANLVSIAACSLVNFLAAERWVFREKEA